MKKYTLHEKHLLITGIGLIISVFTTNTLLLTLMTTLFVISVVINIKTTFGKDILDRTEKITTEKAMECEKNKKYGAAIINYITYPMMVIGKVVLLLSLVTMWINIL